MIRLAIIDHAEHRVYICDVLESRLEKFNETIEEYINHTFNFKGDYSYDIVKASYYVPTDGFSDDLDAAIDYIYGD